MAPVAASPEPVETTPVVQKPDTGAHGIYNIFFSRPNAEESNDGYEFDKYRPRFPDMKWPNLEPIEVVDRGHKADPEKKRLYAFIEKVGGSIHHISPAIGTDIRGVDIRQLGEAERDDLALLVAERGTIVFRNQPLDIHEQLEFGRYFGPLHKHFTTAMPKEPGLEEVHVVYADEKSKYNAHAINRRDLWHSDVTYELQPPGLTTLKLYTAPKWGGDTLWSSGYALYSSFSPEFQAYLEKLKVVHSSVEQANGALAAGRTVRRDALLTEHPLVRVHPVTGLKSIYVNTEFSRRIVGVPKAESDAIMELIIRQIAENSDFQTRLHWEQNDLAVWDNRIVSHSASFDFFPERRHALRVTPHGEKPLSVAEYEEKYGKKAQAWVSPASKALAARQDGVGGVGTTRGYND